MNPVSQAICRRTPVDQAVCSIFETATEHLEREYADVLRAGEQIRQWRAEDLFSRDGSAEPNKRLPTNSND